MLRVLIAATGHLIGCTCAWLDGMHIVQGASRHAGSCGSNAINTSCCLVALCIAHVLLCCVNALPSSCQPLSLALPVALCTLTHSILLHTLQNTRAAHLHQLHELTMHALCLFNSVARHRPWPWHGR